MNFPSNCPICQKNLLNNFREYANSSVCSFEKVCQAPDHYIYFGSLDKNQNSNVVDIILLNINNIYFVWDLKHKTFSKQIRKISLRKLHTMNFTELPFFIPDFSNYSKLYNKLMTLQVFL